MLLVFPDVTLLSAVGDSVHVPAHDPPQLGWVSGPAGDHEGGTAICNVTVLFPSLMSTMRIYTHTYWLEYIFNMTLGGVHHKHQVDPATGNPNCIIRK